MEFDENLAKLEGALMSCQYLMSDPEILRILRPIFDKANETDKLKMVFFMVLNTRLPETNLLMSDPHVGLLTNICPNLTIRQFSDIIVSLELFDSLCVVISNCPGSISVALLNGIHSSLYETMNSHNDKQEALGIGIKKLLIAVFEKSLKILNCLHKEDCYFEKVFSYLEIFTNMLISSRCDISEVKILLDVCIACVKLYKGTENSRSYCDIIKINHAPFEEQNLDNLTNRSLECSDDNIKNYLSYVMSIIKASVKDHSSIDSLSIISESAYLLHEEVQNIKIIPENIGILDSIKSKPKTEFDEISDSNVEKIIFKISENKNARKWFKALVCFPNVFQIEEAVACLLSHLDMADPEDLRIILELIHTEYVKSNSVIGLQTLYFAALRRMKLDDQLLYFNKYFEMKGRIWHESNSFDEELTEMFNKLSVVNESDMETKSDLVCFCIQSPVKTITKICRQALSSSSQLIECFGHLKMLQSACLSAVEGGQNLDVINFVLYALLSNEDITDKEQQYSINLVMRLQKEKFLDDKFIENCVMDIVYKNVCKMNLKMVIYMLEILKTLIKLKLLRCNETVLMAFMAQILNYMSWDCTTFSMQLANTREIIIAVIAPLIRISKFKPSEIVWLRREILKSWEINQYYFCDLWYLYDCDFIATGNLYAKLILLLHTKTKIHSIIDHITTKFQNKKLGEFKTAVCFALIKILPILTSKEWSSLFTHLKSIVVSWMDLQTTSNINPSFEVFDLLTTSLHYLSQDLNRYDDMRLCFEYCIRNLGKVIQENFVRSEVFERGMYVELVKKLLFLLNGIRDCNVRKSNSMILSPIILETRSFVDSASESELQDLIMWFQDEFI